MKKFLIAGNWKMNRLPSELASFSDELVGAAQWKKDAIDVCLAVPATHLPFAKDVAAGVNIAAQNIHWEESGLSPERSPFLCSKI